MRRVRRELIYFLVAVQVLTRLPVPRMQGFADRWMERGVKYFPLTGAIVGVASAAVLLVAAQLWHGLLPALLTVAAGILITGGLHEDGFADFFDSMGGATREARLAIMKDSRIGTYGALALGAGVAIKIFALSGLPLWTAAAGLIAAHAGGRLAAVTVISLLPYAGGISAAKIKPLGRGVTRADLAIAAAFGLLPLLLLPGRFAVTALASGAIAALIAARARGRCSAATPATCWARSSKSTRFHSCWRWPHASDPGAAPEAPLRAWAVLRPARPRMRCRSARHCRRPPRRVGGGLPHRGEPCPARARSCRTARRGYRPRSAAAGTAFWRLGGPPLGDLGRETVEAWRQGLPGAAPPNGETLSAMAARCADWLASLDADGPPVLAVTHAGPIRVIRALIAGEPLLAYFSVSMPFAEPLAVEVFPAKRSNTRSGCMLVCQEAGGVQPVEDRCA